MNRVDFLKQIFAGGASLFFTGHQFEKRSVKKQEVWLTSRYIAGFQYYRGPDIENLLKIDDTLVLKRERDNLHDFYAVEVYYGSNKLGYLSREENSVVARMMDQNINIKGRITEINTDLPVCRRVKMKVYYEDVNS